MPKAKGKDNDASKRSEGELRSAQSQTAKKGQRIPMNLNEYRHLINEGYVTENDVSWVLTLRGAREKLPLPKSNVPPSFYGKSIICAEGKHDPLDIGDRGNSASFEHLIRHRKGNVAGGGQAKFEVGLRDYSKNDKKSAQKLKELELRWRNIPFKDRKEFPSFLPKLKDELDTRKKGGSNGLKGEISRVTGFDGYNNYQKYSANFRYKNINEINHLCTPGFDNPTVKWELSLR